MNTDVWYPRTIAALLLFLLVIAVSALFSLVGSITGEPGVVFVGSDYEYGVFCPGAKVRPGHVYDIKEPVSLAVTSSIAIEGGETVWHSTFGDAPVVNIIVPRRIHDTDTFWVVPDLPPGNYVRNVFIGPTYRNMEPIWFQERFAIDGSCPKF